MATAIINGLNATSHDIIISGSSLPRSREIAEQLEVEAALSHQELIDQSDLVVLGIKPQMFEPVLAGLHFHQPILSMAAGVTLERLGKLTDPNLPLIRIMISLKKILIPLQPLLDQVQLTFTSLSRHLPKLALNTVFQRKNH